MKRNLSNRNDVEICIFLKNNNQIHTLFYLGLRVPNKFDVSLLVEMFIKIKFSSGTMILFYILMQEDVLQKKVQSGLNSCFGKIRGRIEINLRIGPDLKVILDVDLARLKFIEKQLRKMSSSLQKL